MFDAYLALGDSMSIDLYPAKDAGHANLTNREEVGAAALFFCNDSELHPEFAGRDLKSRYPNIEYVNMAIDGGTTEDLLSEARLKELIPFSRKRVLATLTLGGNDLLQIYSRNPGADTNKLQRQFEELQSRYKRVLQTLRGKLPNSTLILTTVYDPTDGTGIMPDRNFTGKVPIEFLLLFNNYVRSCAEVTRLPLADVHQHFSGHGANCGSTENFWYWPQSAIEPGYKGASEIRRTWLDALEHRNK
jgi:lysophospholipase L1-like esterase